MKEEWKNGDILVENFDSDSFIVFKKVDIVATVNEGKLINKLSVLIYAGVNGTRVFSAHVAGTLEDIIKHYHKATKRS